MPPQRFQRVLDMQRGELIRLFQVEDAEGRLFSIEARRFVSKARRELGLHQLSITLDRDPTGRGAAVSLAPLSLTGMWSMKMLTVERISG